MTTGFTFSFEEIHRVFLQSVTRVTRCRGKPREARELYVVCANALHCKLGYKVLLTEDGMGLTLVYLHSFRIHYGISFSFSYIRQTVISTIS